MSVIQWAKRLIAPALACTAGIAVLTGAGGGPASPTATGSGTGVAQPASWTLVGPPVGPMIGGFGITGSVTGLYPGAQKPLTLHLVNHLNVALTVTFVTTSVTSPAAQCAPTNLTVSTFSGHVTLPSLGSASMSVTVRMAHTAPDGCQGVVFTLAYRGLAVRA